MASNVVFCFETKRRGVVKPPSRVQSARGYYILVKVSPNAPNCGIYRKVTQATYLRNS